MPAMVAESVEYESTPWWRRVRAIGLLLVLIVVLGAVAATIIGVSGVAITTLVDHALG
jgi:hypothetical protein